MRDIVRGIDIEELGLTIQKAAIEIAISVDNLNATLNKILHIMEKGDDENE
jgi:hypothetical protein